MVGKSYYDTKDSFYYSIVNSIIPMSLEKEFINTKKYTTKSWSRLLNRFDAYNKTMIEKEEIIGWYHTHKGKQAVYMSEKDMDTHQLFALDWQFGIVLNPQKQIWKVFNGEKAEECLGFILKNNKTKINDHF